MGNCLKRRTRRTPFGNVDQNRGQSSNFGPQLGSSGNHDVPLSKFHSNFQSNISRSKKVQLNCPEKLSVELLSQEFLLRLEDEFEVEYSSEAVKLGNYLEIGYLPWDWVDFGRICVSLMLLLLNRNLGWLFQSKSKKYFVILHISFNDQFSELIFTYFKITQTLVYKLSSKSNLIESQNSYQI